MTKRMVEAGRMPNVQKLLARQDLALLGAMPKHCEGAPVYPIIALE